MAIIAPSLLAANFLQLSNECEMLNKSEADWFHLDVMDGRFVPNISFGPMIIEFIRKATTKTCDVHLMIEEPEKYTEEFKKLMDNKDFLNSNTIGTRKTKLRNLFKSMIKETLICV